jgi:membrane complex biogenesis BtpA family protein
MVDLFARPFAVVGVIHLVPLPGGPRASPGFEGARARALADARALVEGGAHGAIIENYGDAPFSRGAVEPHVVAFVARLAAEIGAAHPDLALGINLLRNDARGAVGAAAAAGATFVRVNVLSGAMVTDQGVIESDAHAVLRYRRELGAAESVRVVADVHVKHAVPLGEASIEGAARDLVSRAGADVVVVTGAGTGQPASAEAAARVRAAIPGAKLWVGSGVTPETAPAWRHRVDGAIVGTALHRGGDVREPIEVERVVGVVRGFGG